MTVSNGAGDNGLLLKAVFWDMDGTLIDSEPYWHEGELKIAAEHGGYWDEDLAWQGSGTPVPDVARRMVEHGCQLSIEEIGKGMIDYVAQKEFERIPWIAGVEDVLRSLAAAGVPSMLVTTSPLLTVLVGMVIRRDFRVPGRFWRICDIALRLRTR